MHNFNFPIVAYPGVKLSFGCKVFVLGVCSHMPGELRTVSFGVFKFKQRDKSVARASPSSDKLFKAAMPPNSNEFVHIPGSPIREYDTLFCITRPLAVRFN